MEHAFEGRFDFGQPVVGFDFQEDISFADRIAHLLSPAEDRGVRGGLACLWQRKCWHVKPVS